MTPAPLEASSCYLARKFAVTKAPLGHIDGFLNAAVEEGFCIRFKDARVGACGGFIAKQYKTVRSCLIHARISSLRMVTKVHVEADFTVQV